MADNSHLTGQTALYNVPKDRKKSMKQVNNTVAALVEKLKNTPKDGWQYLEIKQLGEILTRNREKARLAVREYRLLKQTLAAETDPIEKLYLGYEGMFMRDHLRDALRLYVMVNHDYHDAYQSYMNEVQSPAPLVVPIPSELLSDKRSAVNNNRPSKAA